MYIGAMMVDTHPVTNAQYAEYLEKSQYHPKDSGNWLKQNFEGGVPKKGWENKPVTYVSLEDARAYCSFNKKRLPKPYEWQYFAQGGDGRLYPWGNEEDWSVTPAVNNNFTNPGPEEVGKYPEGASPFGVQDLIRSVWQYTSEFQDIHTRSVILRGGSNYHPFRGKECR
jgi:iron(II)-dependent oxidoreductase